MTAAQAAPAAKPSRRRRARAVRAVQYGVLAAVVVAAALLADWGRIAAAFFDLDVAAAQFPGIITSALVLFCATLGVSFVTSIDLIGAICVMLARGAVISAVVSIFVLPALLCVCEPVFNKTTLYWRKAKPAKVKTEKAPASK